jgi:hypothetical protein
MGILAVRFSEEANKVKSELKLKKCSESIRKDSVDTKESE